MSQIHDLLENDEEEATFKQLKRYGELRILNSLSAKYADIEIKEGHQHHIIGNVVEKNTSYLPLIRTSKGID